MSPVGETRAVVTAGNVTRRIDIYGIMPEYADIRNRTVSAGRWLSERDVEANVARRRDRLEAQERNSSAARKRSASRSTSADAA